jgi:hypothetical protein
MFVDDNRGGDLFRRGTWWVVAHGISGDED